MPLDLDDLALHRTIDLTTYGRKSGRPRTVEIWWFRVDGRFVITGTPGPRDWLANVIANPDITIRVGGEELPGAATPVTDRAFRRKVFTQPETSWYGSQAELELLVDTAPMIEVNLGG